MKWRSFTDGAASRMSLYELPAPSPKSVDTPRSRARTIDFARDAQVERLTRHRWTSTSFIYGALREYESTHCVRHAIP